MAKQDKNEKNILVEHAAKQLGLGVHSLRVALQQGVFDFGVAIKTTDNRYTYYINPKKFYAYLEGQTGGQGAKTDNLFSSGDIFGMLDESDRPSE